MKVVKMIPEYTKLAQSFHCGNDYLDRYIKSEDAYADSTESTYVLFSSDAEIIGYYSISASALQIIEDGVYKKLGGSIHINKFALTQEYQDLTISISEDGVNYHFSDYLIQDCFERILKLRETLGYSFITLSSTDDGLHLYKRVDFETLEDDMALPMDESEYKCTDMYLALDLE